MDKRFINIVIVESSAIIYEGLSVLLSKSADMYTIFQARSIEELNNCCKQNRIDIAIINPVFLMNVECDFLKMKRANQEIYLIGLVYSYFDNEMTSAFDAVMHITDSHDVIYSKLRVKNETSEETDTAREELTEREKEVLIQLSKGLSNKEIADKLNISTHTVISHRKNICDKTGIKSLPGLTIYAITKKIIPLNSY